MSTAIHPGSSSPPNFFTNNIPFMTLNLFVVITLVVNMVLVPLSGAHGVQISAALLVILVKNKAAKKHVVFSPEARV